MKKFIISILVAGQFFACQTGKVPQEARLTVILPENSTGVPVIYDGQLAIIDKDYQQYATQKNEEGKWEVTIPLTKPQYFTLLRNPLYLSPGDNLTIELNADPNLSIIEGVGAEVNNYLKNRFYRKGGSFLRSGSPKIMKPTLEETIVVIDSMMEARRQELAMLEACKTFKRLESMRIKADFVNSLLYYPSYDRNFYGENTSNLSRKDYTDKMNAYFEKIKNIVQPLLDEMSTDDHYLDIEVVRMAMVLFHVQEGYKINSKRFLTLFEIADQSNYIQGSMSRKEYEEFLAFGETIQSEDLKEIYMDRLQRNTKFVEGNPVIDVVLLDLEGRQKKLSDYRGNVLYVDVWATWCGPCRMEAPYFKELSEKYENIRFVAISVDDRKPVWDSYMKSKAPGMVIDFWAESDLRKDWDIAGIPRFLLINKDFTIISSNAPRPSNPEAIETLLERYN